MNTAVKSNYLYQLFLLTFAEYACCGTAVAVVTLTQPNPTQLMD